MAYIDVIQQAVAPAFLLGAVAGFCTVLQDKFTRVVDQRTALDAAGQDEAQADRRRVLARRACLLNRATRNALVSAMAATSLVILSFVYAFFGITHDLGLCLLFAFAMTMLGAAIIDLFREVLIATGEFRD